MKFSDTHFHIDNLEEIENIINESNKSNVKLLVACCCDKCTIDAMDKNPNHDKLYLSYGFHPYEADVIFKEDIEWLKSKLLSNGAVALGEIGLDYHLGKENKEKQKDLFITQLNLAKELNLPVVIHSRDATADTLEILKNYNLKGVIHCFSGSLEVAKEYIKLGYYIGIGGVITFKNSHLSEVVKEIGLNNIVLETDSPYLSPEPFRGKTNTSINIPIIAKKISDVLDVSLDEVADITYNNACVLFDLKN